MQQKAGPRAATAAPDRAICHNSQRAVRREGGVRAKKGVFRAERARPERFWDKSLRYCFASLGCAELLVHSAAGTGIPEFYSLLLSCENKGQFIL